MAKLNQILQLCLPHLGPTHICVLRCTCSTLRDMSVSWQGHSIEFGLGGSVTAAYWLHKNIVTMQHLSLFISFDMPRRMLQDIIDGARLAAEAAAAEAAAACNRSCSLD